MSFVIWLQGKKTYIMAFLLLLYAGTGFLTGHMTGSEALALLWSSGTLASIRAAISKLPQQ